MLINISNYEDLKMDYSESLKKMTDKELLNETKESILKNMASFIDECYYAGAWQHDLCFEECQKRNKLEIYKQAEKEIRK